VSELACPVDRSPLTVEGETLVCSDGHSFPVEGGVPVLLDPEERSTQPGYWATIAEEYPTDDLPPPAESEVDEYVRWVLVGTCGNLYPGENVKGYPIPGFPLRGPGRLLDVGTNWGRWALAARRAGFDVVGVDPSLGAVRAARRVSTQLGLEIETLVAEARHAPFPDASFDVVFSYGVLQHLAPADVAASAREAARLLRPGGVSLHQLPNAYGALNAVRQAQRRREARDFEVRYWKPSQLRRVFEDAIGPTTLSADAFLTISPHPGDLSYLPLKSRLVIGASQAITRVSRVVKPLQRVADSLWVHSVKT
jgi:SAM-dependent methyltransferase